MTRLILDYYRRWSLVLAIGAAVQLSLGWWTAVEAKTPVEFTAMVIPLCVGEILVLLDMARGMFRVVATLPLTPRQIGRSWWLANVLIPAVTLIALLFLGAGVAVICRPDQAFPLHRLSMASLFTALWLGVLFHLFFPGSGKFGAWWQRIFLALLTVVFVLWMVFRALSSFLGYLLSPDAAKNPVNLAIFLAGGTFLTFLGWFRAGRFDPAWAQSRGLKSACGTTRFRLTPLPTAPHQPPEGYGGILFLLRATFIDRFLVCVASAIGFLIFVWSAPRFAGLQSQISLRDGLVIFIVFPLRPCLMQLRLLRTLPISTSKLVAVIIASVILPAIAAGMLMTGIVALSLGTPAAVPILKSCILILAPIALCVSVTVWRGGGVQAYAFFIVAMMAWVLVVAAWQNITFPLAGEVAAIGVVLAGLLTYYALLRGSRAYRAQSNPLGSFTWSARR